MYFCTLFCEFGTVNLSVHATKAYRRSRCVATLIPNLSTKQFLTSHPRCCTPTYPQNRGLGGPKSQLRHFEEEKNFLPLPETKTPITQYVIHSPHYVIPVPAFPLNQH